MALPGFLLDSAPSATSITDKVPRETTVGDPIQRDVVTPQLRIDPLGPLGGGLGFSWPSRCEWECNFIFGLCIAFTTPFDPVCAATLGVCLGKCYSGPGELGGGGAFIG
jgi:hypothetical protein